MSLARLARLALVALLLSLTVPSALAQKLARGYYEDEANGYKFKPLDGYVGVPTQPGDTSGLVTQMTSESNEIQIFALYDTKATGGEDGKTTAGKRRTDIAALLSRKLQGFEPISAKPTTDDTVKSNGGEARRRIWELKDFYIEAWSYTLSHADIAIVFITEKERFDKKWRSTIDKSGRSFTLIERKVTADVKLGEGATYEQQLAKAEADAEKTPGWHAMSTPSKKFIIVTNCEKPQFLAEVIKRLEGSRKVFEKDFPPPPDFDAVSIVRVCGSEEEFHRYGGTGGGVAGWFSPTTTELVLYDAVNTDRNSTYAVVVHESFHQYCHFLFGQAEAHRWFDEGHGDYYGGLSFETSRPKIGSRMPSGLNRLDVIREMVREGSYKPIQDHVNYDHQRWQTQGPSNVSCYAQSWSIIYYLRQGADGAVPRKVWKKEYADIIPNYVRVLTEGYRKAFDEIVAERRKEAKEKGEDPDAVDTRVNRMAMYMAFGPERQAQIWREAMAASWGQIDMDVFEKDWVTYVEDILK
ncbi:MAG: hypothetical protein R3F49_09325 [Planctomycetota bacterium]